MTATARNREKVDGAEEWTLLTTATKIQRLFAVGRPREKDRVVSPLTALAQAADMLTRVQRAMEAADLAMADVNAELVVNGPSGDGGPVVTHEFFLREGSAAQIIERLLQIPNASPIGIIFSIKDREAAIQPMYRQWAMPFLTGPDALATLQSILDEMKQGKHGQWMDELVTGKSQ